MSTAERDRLPRADGCEHEEYLLKPMNCPHHIQIYTAEPRSYRDLPVRLAEFGTVYRYEQTGELDRHDPRPRLHPGRRPPVLHPRAGRAASSAADDRADAVRPQHAWA